MFRRTTQTGNLLYGKNFSGQQCNNIMNMKMEDVRYESPQIEILRMEVAQTILSASFTGEGINEWKEM